MNEELDPRLAKALDCYQVISSYIADPPPRGQRAARRKHLASKVWIGADGEPFQVSAETIRSWIRKYNRNKLEGLMDKSRPRRGVRALPEEVIDTACKLKKEVPQRTLDRLIQILEGLEMVEIGLVKRSTLHRALQARGLSRIPTIPDCEDLDRFEASAPNALWQSDMLAGPWLPDPARPGKMRRTWLYAFLDDYSRLIVAGRFSFKGDLPALELVLRRAVQKYGVCKRLYYDNAQVYRSGHMKQIAAALGIERIVYTQRYRPMGHGKIEAWNRLAKRSFIAEVAASKIATLTELNEAFTAWVSKEYNTGIHGETGQTPVDRWRTGIDSIRYADEEDIRVAFLWKERRKADKSGLLSLHGVKYQVGPELAGRYVDVLYDPQDMLEIEVQRDGRLQERVRPFEVAPWRRPRPATPDAPNTEAPRRKAPRGRPTSRARSEGLEGRSGRPPPGQHRRHRRAPRRSARCWRRGRGRGPRLACPLRSARSRARRGRARCTHRAGWDRSAPAVLSPAAPGGVVVNTPTIAPAQKRRLQAHFGFTGVPFRKNVRALKMFDSASQRELWHALRMWLEVQGLAVITGPTGVGKSITTRRFAVDLNDARYKMLRLGQAPTTPIGFLRSLNRLLGLPMRRHAADLFDQARDHLTSYAESHGPHPVLIIDDAEGMKPAALDLVRRLTHWELDAADRFSVLIIGTEDLLTTLRRPELASLRSRFSYACQLRPFSLEDTRNYIRFHLEGAGVEAGLFSDEAAREIFLASEGAPRRVNQLAVQALIHAAVKGRDELDGRFLVDLITHHPLFGRGDR